MDGYASSSAHGGGNSSDQCNNDTSQDEQEIAPSGETGAAKKKRKPSSLGTLAMENMRRKRMREGQGPGATTEDESADSDFSQASVPPMSRSASVDPFVDDEFLRDADEAETERSDRPEAAFSRSKSLDWTDGSRDPLLCGSDKRRSSLPCSSGEKAKKTRNARSAGKGSSDQKRQVGPRRRRRSSESKVGQNKQVKAKAKTNKTKAEVDEKVYSKVQD